MALNALMVYPSMVTLKWRLEPGLKHLFFIRFIKNRISRKHVFYILANYLALLVNFFSGVLIARELGAQSRGIYALITSIFGILFAFGTFNYSGGTLQASMFAKEAEKARKLSALKVPGFVGLVAAVFALIGISLANLLKAWKEYENVIIGAAIVSSLGAVSAYIGSLFVTNHLIVRMAIARFVGLGGMSLMVILLYLSNKITIQNLLICQILAAIVIASNSLLLFTTSSKLRLPPDSIVIKNSLIGLPKYVIDFFVPIFLYSTVSSDYGAVFLGIYIVAWGWASLSDALLPVIESQVYNNYSIKGFQNTAIRNLLNKILIMFIFNLSLTPTLILIPFLFGEEFNKSVQIGIFLFAFKFLGQATSILEIIANLKRQNLFLLLQVIGWLISFTLCTTILEMKSLSSLVICLYIAQSVRLLMAFINIKQVISQERKI